GVNIVGTLATIGAFDHHRNEVRRQVHVSMVLSAHGRHRFQDVRAGEPAHDQEVSVSASSSSEDASSASPASSASSPESSSSASSEDASSSEASALSSSTEASTST